MASTCTSSLSSLRRTALMALLLLGYASAWAAQPSSSSSSSSSSLSKRSHTSSSRTTQLPVSYSSSAGAAATAAPSIPKWNLPTPQSSSSTANLQRKRFTGRYSQQHAEKTTTNTTATTTTATTNVVARPKEEEKRRFRVYCDLDGVLVDFESGIRKLFPNEFDQEEEELAGATKGNFNVDDLHRGTMWKRVAAASPAFFEHLPWTHQGRLLWNTIAPLKPDILTGVPTVAYASKSSSVEKYKWCQRELGVPVTHHDKVILDASTTSWTTRARKFLIQQQQSENDNVVDHFYNADADNNDDNNKEYTTRVITCWSRHKYLESGENAVLIDDRLELRHDWEAAGGTFIHHNGNVHETIQKLRRAGILQPEEGQESHHHHHHHKNHHGMWP